ncbi:Outer membrane chaperone Skp (OmpH) [Nitrosococcus oceani ATCC 19707]|uniref:Outer membrane chaperone Skp (OmpH) n=3 Tax=Nitrosococcus oceani TaxID=1229 RepID=Q3JCW6_NITOC|nr:Outer membrane chaperone Skp (OmpH) [Nitrosococcus oceani ATCC 19707]KFI20306.1 membrane protein [Nitrosococcus oceani C-27]KFI23408.1 membrane protein [Nitrosococcus oceani]
MVRMDKLFKLIVFVAFLLLGSMIVIAPAGAVDLKIGAVNAVKLLDEAPQKEAALEILKKEFEVRNRELVAKQKKLRGLEDRFNRDAAIMSEADRKALERDILNQNRDLKRDQEVFREDYNIRRNEEFRKLQEEIAKAIVDLAEKKKYDLVVYEGVIYASDKVDITADVLKLLKSQYRP